MAKAGLGLMLTCLLGSGAWGAAFTSTYLFNNATEVPSLANATYTPFSVTGPGLQATVNGTFDSLGWSTGAQLPTQFVQFTLTPAAGAYLNMQSISFQAWHKQSVIGAVEIFQGIGPGMTSRGTAQFTTLGTTPPATPINFDFVDFSGTDGQGITVRFYGWNAQNGQDSLFFDNVMINGNLNPVPEPVNFALAGFGLCFVGAAVHRKLRAKSGPTA